MNDRRPDEKRKATAFIFVIVLGLVIGILIKRVHIGLMIGLALGLFASGILRKR